jgi:hypothetical protein
MKNPRMSWSVENDGRRSSIAAGEKFGAIPINVDQEATADVIKRQTGILIVDLRNHR